MSGPVPIPKYRPMTVSLILERVFRLLRANFKLMIGIAALPGLALLFFYGIVLAVAGKAIIPIMQSHNPEEVLKLTRILMPLLIPVTLIYIFVFALYLAAACHAAVLVDRGIPVKVGEAYGVALSRAGHYVLLLLALYGVTFLPALLAESPLFVVAGMGAMSKAVPNPAVLLIFPFEFFLIFGLLIAGAIIALRLSLAFPASVFESLKVKDSIKRSWTLTRGALGRIFLTMLLIYAAIYALMMVIVLAVISVAGIGFLFFGSEHHYSGQAIVLLAVLAAVLYASLIAAITVVTWAGFTTACAVIYNDQRSRIEVPVVEAFPPIPR